MRKLAWSAVSPETQDPGSKPRLRPSPPVVSDIRCVSWYPPIPGYAQYGGPDPDHHPACRQERPSSSVPLAWVASVAVAAQVASVAVVAVVAVVGLRCGHHFPSHAELLRSEHGHSQREHLERAVGNSDKPERNPDGQQPSLLRRRVYRSRPMPGR